MLLNDTSPIAPMQQCPHHPSPRHCLHSASARSASSCLTLSSTCSPPCCACRTASPAFCPPTWHGAAAAAEAAVAATAAAGAAALGAAAPGAAAPGAAAPGAAAPGPQQPPLAPGPWSSRPWTPRRRPWTRCRRLPAALCAPRALLRVQQWGGGDLPSPCCGCGSGGRGSAIPLVRMRQWGEGTCSTSLPPKLVGSSQTLLTEAREYLPDVDHAVFKHFRIIKRVEGKAQQYECKFCSNVYTGAAIRCAQHFMSWKGMKRREVMLCKDAPQDVRLAMRAKYEAKAAAAEEKRRAAAEAVAAVKANGVKRARITDYLDGDAAARKREADEALALAWAALHIPEHHIDHPLMVNALNLVKRAGVDYVPPKRKYIGGAGLLSCRNGIEQDGRDGFVRHDDGPQRQAAGQRYVAGILRPVVEVGPENVVAFCMDGGSNYAVAVKQLIREWPHIQDVPCATHVLDLLMEDVGKMGWAKPVVDKGGEISSFVRNHHWTRGYLRKPELVEGKVLQALKPAGTRFGTNYIAISWLCAMRGSLTNMVTSEGWKEWAVGDRKKSCDGFSALIHDAAWWKTAEFFVALLKLPFKVMRQTDGHAVGMMGRLYDLMLQLTEDVGGLLDADEEQLSDGDKDKIRRILRDRWDGSLACAMHVASRILNPANQEEDIFGTDLECTKVFKAFISQQAEFLASRRDGGDDACDILLELGDGLRAFLDMKGSFGMPEAVAQRKLVKEGKYSMVKWWQWNGTDAPRVAGLAVRVLSQAVSASPCERGWSSWDAVHTARRNRLGSAKCGDLVYVAHNWNVVRNWHTRADVLPHVVPGIGAEPPIPVGYNGLEDETKGEDEEEGEDDILEDEYAN
ncbi:unnamed protein product [Closterium sp. NIES-54]